MRDFALRAEIGGTPRRGFSRSYHYNPIQPTQRNALMSRKFIAAIVALSLTVTGVTASQADAADKRTRNLIVGAAALAILGAAISNKSRDDNSYVGTSNTRHRGHAPQRAKPHHKKHAHQAFKPRQQSHSRHGVTPRPLPPRARAGQLPNRCLRSYPTRGGGVVQRYDARCVEQVRRNARNQHYTRR